jgi:hypothetical protein
VVGGGAWLLTVITSSCWPTPRGAMRPPSPIC